MEIWPYNEENYVKMGELTFYDIRWPSLLSKSRFTISSCNDIHVLLLIHIENQHIPLCFLQQSYLNRVLGEGVIRNRLAILLIRIIYSPFLLTTDDISKGEYNLLLATTVKLNHNFYRINILPNRLKICERLILILKPSQLCLFCLISHVPLFALEFSCR